MHKLCHVGTLANSFLNQLDGGFREERFTAGFVTLTSQHVALTCRGVSSSWAAMTQFERRARISFRHQAIGIFIRPYAHEPDV